MGERDTLRWSNHPIFIEARVTVMLYKRATIPKVKNERELDRADGL